MPLVLSVWKCFNVSQVIFRIGSECLIRRSTRANRLIENSRNKQMRCGPVQPPFLGNSSYGLVICFSFCLKKNPKNIKTLFYRKVAAGPISDYSNSTSTQQREGTLTRKISSLFCFYGTHTSQQRWATPFACPLKLLWLATTNPAGV